MGRKQDTSRHAKVRKRFAGPAQPSDSASLSSVPDLLAQERYTEAFVILEKAVSERPNDAALLLRVGKVLKQYGNKERAVSLLETASRLKPGDLSTLIELGFAYQNTKRLSQAEEVAQRILALDASNVDAAGLIGTICQAEGRFEDGLDVIRKALARTPGNPYLHWRLASLYQSAGESDAADEYYRKALTAAPDSPSLRYDHSLLLLTMGRFEAGWREYAHRFQGQGLIARRIAGTPWQGEPLPDGRLLLQYEQGLGDMLQQARYIPLILQRLSQGSSPSGAATLFVMCQPELKRLLARNFPEVTVIDREEAEQRASSFTRVCSVFELPRLFHPTEGTPDAPVPYLTAATSAWPSRLESNRRLTVGLIWAGSPTHANDRLRSLSLDELAPLLQTEGVTFVSLQMGPKALSKSLPPTAVTMLDPTPLITDFEDTAAILSSLDLIITADTSAAHLAGALGRPTWIFIPRNPDWRWMYDRDDSPWYPSVRLFRMRKGETWTAVVERMTLALQAFVTQQQARCHESAATAVEATPIAPLPDAPCAPAAPASPRLPRVLVVPLSEVNQPSTTLGLRAVKRLLPVDAQVRVAALDTLPDDEEIHDSDLVIVGVGDDLTPALARNRALHALLQRGARAVGIFGTREAEGIDPATMSTLLDALQIWMARSGEDVSLFGRGRANVVHLGHWLINAVPLHESTNPVPIVAGDPSGTPPDVNALTEMVMAFTDLRATTPLSLLLGLSSARRVRWDTADEAIDALMLDVFGQRYEQGQWINIDRKAVMAYRWRLRTLETELATLLGSLLCAPR